MYMMNSIYENQKRTEIMKTDLLSNCLGINSDGHLTIGGVDTLDIASEYGTPAYVLDEAEIRRACHSYKSALNLSYGSDSFPLYAGKALCCKYIYKIIEEEGLGADVVSSGELYTALSAGFPADRLYFHGNNKTHFDIEYAIKENIRCIIADNFDELDEIEATAEKYDKTVNVLLRVSPGIDSHTHRAVSTGMVDSKFGMAIATGQAMELVKYALNKKHINLEGLHCHIGSQIFEYTPFYDAAVVMINFLSEIRKNTGTTLRILNLGGGFGVRYVSEHREMDIPSAISKTSEFIKKISAEMNFPCPNIIMEPGRSIMASAGITLYTVGSVKEIKGFRNYVSIDGGMTDNPRYALYQSPYTAVIADHAADDASFECTIAGRCCESGDLIGENMMIQNCKRGDILAVLTTGAYNYSMASNYNRIPRPPIIVVKNGKTFTAVRRESFEDIVKCDII